MRKICGAPFLALFFLTASCTDYGREECPDDCSSKSFNIAFFEGGSTAIDSLSGDSLRLVVIETGTMRRNSVSADCNACQSLFRNQSLTSDLPLVDRSGDTLHPGANLLANEAVADLGVASRYSVDFFRSVEFKSGDHTFQFSADLDGKAVTATGTLRIPAQRGF